MSIVRRHVFGPVEGFELGHCILGVPTMTVFMYVVDGLLIDSGQRHMHSAVFRRIENRRIDRILLTHHHEDHSGNAGSIAEKMGVPVFGHPLMAEKMAAGFDILPYQHLFFGKADRVQVNPVPERIETDHFRFRAIHTPGHSKDHVVFLEENGGRLFSGDLYVGERIRFFRSDERIEEQIRSLRRVLRFDFESIFCGHRPCLKKGPEALKRKLDFLENFHGEIENLLEKGLTFKEIAGRMKEQSDLRVKWVTMGNASFAHMVRSSLRGHRNARRKRKSGGRTGTPRPSASTG